MPDSSFLRMLARLRKRTVQQNRNHILCCWLISAIAGLAAAFITRRSGWLLGGLVIAAYGVYMYGVKRILRSNRNLLARLDQAERKAKEVTHA